MFRSSPNAGGRSAYQLLWTVDSYSPIQEYRLLYRQIQPYHKVRYPTFLISSSSSLNGKSEQENFSCKKRERKWRTSSVLWTSKSFSVFPRDSYYCCDFIAFNSDLRSVLLPWLKNFCQSSFFFEETQVHKKRWIHLGQTLNKVFCTIKRAKRRRKKGGTTCSKWALLEEWLLPFIDLSDLFFVHMAHADNFLRSGGCRKNRMLPTKKPYRITNVTLSEPFQLENWPKIVLDNHAWLLFIDFLFGTVNAFLPF